MCLCAALRCRLSFFRLASTAACMKIATSSAIVAAVAATHGADLPTSPGSRALRRMEAPYRELAAIAMPNIAIERPSEVPRAAFLASWERRDPV